MQWRWACTGEGVARFDGYGFTIFGADEGLPLERADELVVLVAHLGPHVDDALVTRGDGLDAEHPRRRRHRVAHVDLIELVQNSEVQVASVAMAHEYRRALS